MSARDVAQAVLDDERRGVILLCVYPDNAEEPAGPPWRLSVRAARALARDLATALAEHDAGSAPRQEGLPIC